MLGLDGEHVYSHTFDIRRGVIEDRILIPIFYISSPGLVLDQLFQEYDPAGPSKGVRVIKIDRIHVLGYADDVDMAEDSAGVLSERLSTLSDTDAVIEHADIHVKL